MRCDFDDESITESAWQRWQTVYQIKRRELFQRILNSLPKAASSTRRPGRLLLVGKTPPDGKEKTMDTSDNHEHQHRGSSSPKQEYDRESGDRSNRRKGNTAARLPEKKKTDAHPGDIEARKGGISGK